MTEWTNCEGCPCLNSDYEYGTSCNLGYTTGYLQISEEPREFRHLSNDCDLIEIVTKEKKFTKVPSDLDPLPSIYARQMQELFETEIISENPRIVRVKEKDV